MALYKRPGSEYWWMKFMFDGELIQRSTKCKNKRDAQTVESALKTQKALAKVGIEPPKEAPALDDAIEDFLKWSKIEHALQDATYKRYYYSSQVLKKYFGKVRADRVESKDVEAFVVWRATQKSRKTGEFITRETVNHELFTLKTIFKRLVEAKFLRDNPAQTIKKLSENVRSFHVLSLDDEARYLLLSPQPLRDVATIMLETGMRCGEVYRMRRQDVLLTEGYLKVVKGKTAASVRRVHLSEKAKDVIRARMERFEGEYLFPQGDNDYAKATASLDKQHLIVRDKLKMNFRLYDCRHTFATRAVEDGVDLVVLASILGHSSLRMVMRYSHPSENFKAEAVKKMERSKAAKTEKARQKLKEKSEQKQSQNED